MEDATPDSSTPERMTADPAAMQDVAGMNSAEAITPGTGSRLNDEHSNVHGANLDGASVEQSSIGIEQLVEAHYAEIYRYAYRLAGNSVDAADLTQQAFLNAHQNLLTLRDTSKSRGWLYAIIRNTFLKSRRKKKPVSAGNMEFELENIPDPAIAAGDGPDDFDPEALQSAISDLPEEFRVVVLMFYFEEFSYREIAHALEIPEGTVMSRLSRAKGHLRKRLSRG